MSALFLENKKDDIRSLNLHNIIENETIVLVGYGDFTPHINSQIFLAKTLYITKCDKNFVYYWIRKNKFPYLQTIYLDSHPCESSFFGIDVSKIYLSDHYKHYYEKWSKYNNNNNVEIIKRDDFNNLIGQLKKIEIKFENDISRHIRILHI
ncbi:hypothetical protein ma745 [Moumouvirus australiensis]|uniref:Uncharacterized protein n=1 Tax=Moumouvirus australiensis TaxID=2109587 RepID=A0A2P1EMP8_9VIRU|nr:hypothetical protein QKC55_gp159 [Moumouvirus australiensis]AVL95132.1 hypothetical protein ma745 [Moumouvirus australiensis]QGR54261.1 hypothetical protein [Moumouvirus maliensis]